MFLNPTAAYEDQVINHAPIVQEIKKKARASTSDLGAKSTYNPKTKKYFGVSDCYVPDPVVWRHDLWNDVGESPTLGPRAQGGAEAEGDGHPIGIGMSNELDSNMANIAFMMCFGSFIQNAEQPPMINSKNTVDALKFMALYKSGETTRSSAGTRRRTTRTSTPARAR